MVTRYTNKEIKQIWNALGLRGAVAYFAGLRWRYLLGIDPDVLYRLWAKSACYPLWCRPGTSDRRVFNQIFIEQEYEPFGSLINPRTILDCGANIGCASAWWLSRFPNAEVVAVEPDPSNVMVLKRNLGFYGQRARIYQNAIWTDTCKLRLCREATVGAEWAICVRPAQEGEQSDVAARDIPTLMSEVNWPTCDLLKLDIEGAEMELFRNGPPAWLDRVGAIIIELHGDKSRELFRKALPEDRYKYLISGELTLALDRIRPPVLKAH